MGMSEPGDLKRLLAIAEPDVALVTKVALAHSAFFPDGLEGIARGKAEIFSEPQTAHCRVLSKTSRIPFFCENYPAKNSSFL